MYKKTGKYKHFMVYKNRSLKKKNSVSSPLYQQIGCVCPASLIKLYIKYMNSLSKMLAILFLVFDFPEWHNFNNFNSFNIFIPPWSIIPMPDFSIQARVSFL